jgi:diacylglycerol O-acyltransferase / wax synthase
VITRLSGDHALSLHTETSTTPAHAVSVITIEGTEQISHERLHRFVASSVPQLARFRSRLVGKPFGIGQPIWAEIRDYDPTSQIHRATVRSPGGQVEFADLIEELSRRPLVPHKGLWEAWSIDGLAGGRWALALKMSPALSGAGGDASAIWPRLLHAEPRDNPNEDLQTEPSLGAAPSVAELITDAVTEMVENHVTVVWLISEAATGALSAVRHRLRGADEADAPRNAPPTSALVPHAMFNAPLSARRAIAFASISLTDVETVAAAFGGSTANVFLAACTLSLRAWLQRYDIVPDEPLLMQVPLSLPGGDPAATANTLTDGHIRLPVQLDDPVQVLTDLHTAIERLNIACRDDAQRSYQTVDLATIAAMIPPRLVRLGTQIYTGLGLRRWREPICHGCVSYASGVQVPAYCTDARVIGMYSAPPLRDGRGLNITVNSHDDVMDVCVCVCPDNVRDVNDIATGIAESIRTLVGAAQRSPRGHGRSVVSEMTSHSTKRSHTQDY